MGLQLTCFGSLSERNCGKLPQGPQFASCQIGLEVMISGAFSAISGQEAN
jgi:hypothetical protein